LAIIDTATHTVTNTLHFAPPGVPASKVMPVGVRFTPDGKTALVALGRGNAVAFVDVATATVTGYVPVGQRVWHLAIEPDGKRAFAANGLTNDVSVIDIATRTVIATIPAGQAPWGVAIAR
jgi:YVTN family beta-propeller protein